MTFAGTAYPDTQKMRIVADIFQAGGVDIVFSSFIHVYQRSKPLRFQSKYPHSAYGRVTDYGHEIDGVITTDDSFNGSTRTIADGVIYIVSGCGGQRLHDGGTCRRNRCQRIISPKLRGKSPPAVTMRQMCVQYQKWKWRW